MSLTTQTMPPESLAKNYLNATADRLLEIAERGNVLAWRGFETIGYRQEILQALEPLRNTQNFPPFLAIMLILSASRENWSDQKRLRAMLSRYINDDVEKKSESTSEKASGSLAMSTWKLLDRVHRIPAAIRNSAAGKAELFAYIFPAQQKQSAVGDSVFEWLTYGFSSELKVPQSDAVAIGRKVERALWFLQSALRHFNTEAFVEFVQTGTDFTPEIVELDLPAAEKASGLIDELSEDVQYYALALAARQLISVISLPRRMENDNELREGGVSDITNRGSLDRLLISELANDSLTLAIRVALGEALYYEREVPPSPPAANRVIFLDDSVFMWGRPRFVQAAAALALAAQSKNEVCVFRLNRKCFEPARILTKPNMISHLENCQASSDSTAAWAALPQNSEFDHDAERFWITDRSSWEDAKTKNAVLESPLPPEFIVICERSGKLTLIQMTSRGQKVILTSELDLDLRRTSQVPKSNSELSKHWPSTIRMPLPLRLAHPIDQKRTWNVDLDKRISLSKDGRVLLWDDPACFARELVGKVPHLKLICSQTQSYRDTVAAIVGKGDEFSRVYIDLNDGSVEVREMAAHQYSPLRFSTHQDVIFGISDYKITAWDCASLDQVDQINFTSQMEHVSTRIIRQGDEVFVLTFESGIKLVPLLKLSRDGYTNLFECPAVGEFFYRKIKGEIIRVSDNKAVLKHSGSIQVSRCGRYASSVYSPAGLWDLSSGESKPYGSVHLAASHTWNNEDYLKKIKRVGIHGGRIVLESSRGAMFELVRIISSPSNRVQFRLQQATEHEESSINYLAELQEVKTSRGFGRIKLKRAEFDDGRSIWLDSRGLLHVVDEALDSGTGLGGLAFVLRVNSPEIAGFTSNGGSWGARQYTGHVKHDPTSEAIDHFSFLTKRNSAPKITVANV